MAVFFINTNILINVRIYTPGWRRHQHNRRSKALHEDQNSLLISMSNEHPGAINHLYNIFCFRITECPNEYDSNNGDDDNGMPALHRRLVSQHWITAVQRQHLDRNCLRPIIKIRPKIRVNAQIQIWDHQKVELFTSLPFSLLLPLPNPQKSLKSQNLN